MASTRGAAVTTLMKPGPTPKGESRGRTSCSHRIFLMLEFQYSGTIRMWQEGVLLRLFQTMLTACSTFCKGWGRRAQEYVLKSFPVNRIALFYCITTFPKNIKIRCSMLQRYKVNRSKGSQNDPHNILRPQSRRSRNQTGMFSQMIKIPLIAPLGPWNAWLNLSQTRHS